MTGPPTTTGLRRLSTEATTFWKRIFPPTWITGAGVFTYAVWADLIGSPAPTVMKVVTLGAWLAFSPFFIWWSRRLTHVWLDGDQIVVPHQGREYRIDIASIRGFEESRFQRVKLITIDVGHPTPVGDKLVFVAPFAWQAPFGEHPLVAELRERKRALAGGSSRGALGEGRGKDRP